MRLVSTWEKPLCWQCDSLSTATPHDKIRTLRVQTTMNEVVAPTGIVHRLVFIPAHPSHVSIHFPSYFSPSSSSSMRPAHVTPWILGIALPLVQGDCTPYLAVRARRKRKRYTSSTSMSSARPGADLVDEAALGSM